MANFYILGVLLLVSNALALEHIFHDGKEYKYNYEMYATSVAMDPTPFAAVFAYRGVLRIQAHADHVTAKLDDVTMANYNGRYDFDNYPEMTFVPKPELTSEMSHPFRVHYKKNGQVNAVEVTEEHEWATNMKKATAALLQLHLESLQKKREVFTLDEETLHGTCPINYEVTPCPDDPEHTKVIRKHRHNHDCHDRIFRFRSVTEGYFCPIGKTYNDPVHSSSFQTYHVENKDGHEHIKRIDVMSNTVFRPFENAGQSQFSFINHTLVLEGFGDIQEEIKVEGEVKRHDDLHYHFRADEHPKTVDDLKVSEEFFGTKLEYTYPQEKSLEHVEKHLGKVADSLEEHHIHKDIVKAYKAALYVALPEAMALDYDHWKKLYDNVKEGIQSDRDETIKELYLELLGMTGTSPSALALLDLIKDDSESRPHLLRLLAILPFNLQEPTEILTDQFLPLLDKFRSEGSDVKISYRVATLALANLVGRTCKHQCSDIFLNKYIDFFYDNFQS